MKRYLLEDISLRPGLLFHLERGWLTAPFAPHTHDFRELTVILKGEATHHIDNQTYHVMAGDVYVLQGDTQHGFSDVHDLEFYNVMFPCDMEQIVTTAGTAWRIEQEIRTMPGYQALFVLEPFYRKEHHFMNRLQVDPRRLQALEFLLANMMEEYRHGGHGWRALLQASFTTLLVMLSRWAEEPHGLATGNLRAIAEAVAYLEAHFDEPLRMDMLAERAHLSPRHFGRIFASNYGMPPMEYLQRLRLRSACDLLRRSHITVTRIAQECGYRDGNLFSRQFREQYGITPTQYRKLYG